MATSCSTSVKHIVFDGILIQLIYFTQFVMFTVTMGTYCTFIVLDFCHFCLIEWTSLGLWRLEALHYDSSTKGHCKVSFSVEEEIEEGRGRVCWSAEVIWSGQLLIRKRKTEALGNHAEKMCLLLLLCHQRRATRGNTPMTVICHWRRTTEKTFQWFLFFPNHIFRYFPPTICYHFATMC